MSGRLCHAWKLAALLAAASGAAAAPAAAPFQLRGPQGQPITLESFDAALSEPPGAPPEEPSPAAPRDLHRRSLFARLFGEEPAAPPAPPLHTRYPVVLVHGANTPKDLRLGKLRFRYFSHTEAHLRSLDLRLLVPEVNPFGSIEERAGQLEAQIQKAIPEGKFNIVAHSMGGLDARYLASRSSLKDRIASITTVATPHHGAWYADFAKRWVFERQGLNKLGGLFGLRFDQIPALTVEHMEGTFNPATPDNPDVAYFSYGTAAPIWKSPPHFWGMNLITRLMELRAVRSARLRGAVPLGVRSKAGEVRLDPGAPATLARAAQGADAGWVVPEWAGRNDGVVSLSSSVWGTYLGTIPGHHWSPMGWVSFVKEYKVWEAILRRLQTQGF